MKLKTIYILLRIVVVLYLLLWVSVYAGQRYIVFHPEVLDDDFQYAFDADFKEGFLETNDKVPINYLHFKTEEARRGVILYFHGNSENLDFWGAMQKDFTSRGYDVFMIDYRGFGKSEGKVSEQKTYVDAKMTYDFLLQQGYRPEEIILYGRSLGSGIAAQLATHVAARQLVLETPYYNMRSLFLDQVFILWLPFDLKYQFRNDQHIPQVPYPVTIIHGTEDRVVPYRNAIRLKEKLNVKDSFITIEDGAHKNLGTYPLFQQTLDRILLPADSALSAQPRLQLQKDTLIQNPASSSQQ